MRIAENDPETMSCDHDRMALIAHDFDSIWIYAFPSKSKRDGLGHCITSEGISVVITSVYTARRKVSNVHCTLQRP